MGSSTTTPPRSRLELEIQPQPDDITCGPTALHSVYRYYGDPIEIEQVVAEVPMLEDGGTLAVMLGCHALRRGFAATIFTYNLQMFDPTWFEGDVDLAERLTLQREAKNDSKLRTATDAYLEFLRRGGQIRFEELTGKLLRRYLARGRPILTGLSATYLYHKAREIGATNEPDDVRGEPVGHFVVLSGYDKHGGTVHVADPYATNPAGARYYHINIDRVIAAILLGVLTYDANLLLVRPPRPLAGSVET
ncbi:MAG: C39 family peptidase [Nannocystaceae bacterium]|nr:C39 family peptidase [Nannocystaceae bacterium]